MIEFTKMKDVDIKNFLKFINENEIEINNIEKHFLDIFLVKYGEKIYGFSILTLQVNQCILEEVFITPAERSKGYGDGLLRSMLNYAYCMSIEKAYYLRENPKVYGFLLKEGFNREKTANNNIIFTVNLKDFFTKPCAGGKK
ncbi:GNAT family N-acetyltransferase [Irregularibacter muris]|uniref:GNAT family N-acetyltransferase n=1 Tax=Irregularibacter muris TaxID=1796619 RepID=A0AAE3KYR7_9FIRM|nr:GNAT family N-acetyltransferase [Irregularibacter muris]MCR1898050.1 GNAT family N-acetyltransferase [Irregularibacter muris]